ncbi:MAG: hypothetical protein HKO98_15015, partial [Gemmatimonadetes bacterium]|nr:hypothetical protein [Gemmatimonadota bacterium]
PSRPTRFPLRPSRLPLAFGLALSTFLSSGIFAAPAAAQFGPGNGPVARAFELGGRAGYDFRSDAPLLGAYARSSIVRRVALQVTGDLTFLDGITERRATGELLVQASPGVWIGAGAALLNSVFERSFDSEGVRESRVGYTIVGLLGGGGRGRVGTGLEIRFTSVDDFRSQLVALQVGIPIARW